MKNRGYMWAWISFALYFFFLALLSSHTLRILLLVSTFLLLSLALFFLYRIIESDVFFYTYNFLALVTLPIALEGYDPYSWVTVALAYSLLSLLLLHIYLYRFFSKFGMIKGETILYVLLSLPLSFVSVYIFINASIGRGFWGAVALIIVIVVLLYFLIHSESEKRSDAA